MAANAFGDGYNGGGRRCGELYNAKAGLVVNDSSPYGLTLAAENPIVGDRGGGEVLM